MESVTISSATGKRASRSSTSSSEMGLPKLDVHSEGQGRNNPSFNHEENDIPENQTYYADELISVPDLEKVNHFFKYTRPT